MTNKSHFRWDETKNQENKKKHGISFEFAQYAFADTKRIILEDLAHSEKEKRYYCIGKIDEGIVTVRFTYRKKSDSHFWCRILEKGEKFI